MSVLPHPISAWRAVKRYNAISLTHGFWNRWNFPRYEVWGENWIRGEVKFNSPEGEKHRRVTARRSVSLLTQSWSWSASLGSSVSHTEQGKHLFQDPSSRLKWFWLFPPTASCSSLRGMKQHWRLQNYFSDGKFSAAIIVKPPGLSNRMIKERGRRSGSEKGTWDGEG